MTGVREDIVRADRWEAWSEDREALRRLCGAIETFAETNRARELAAIDAGADSEWVKEQRKERVIDVWKVGARATEPEYNRTRTGSPDEVIDTLDERTVESFACDLSTWGDVVIHISASMDRRYGAQVRVSGSDPPLVHSVFTEIAVAMKRGVPKWSWVRKASALWIVVVGALAFLATYPHTTGIKTPSIENRLLASGLVALWFGFVFGVALSWAIRRLFPGFEITAPGGQGSSSRILWFLLALVASAAISVAIAIYR